MDCPVAIEPFISTYTGATPHLVMVLKKIADRYRCLEKAMPEAKHHYAVKANPHPEILRSLHALGCRFECASIVEIDACLAVGTHPQTIIYGNPVKKVSEIIAARQRGVTTYVFDSLEECQKIARHAPNSKVLCRITTSGEGALLPLTVKFGTPAAKASEWLINARNLGLIPVGISFHVGSQQLDPNAWKIPINQAAEIFSDMKAHGINSMSILDIGGGFPVGYRKAVLPVETFAKAIDEALQLAFGGNPPEIYTEPGRYIVAEAGYILSEVVLVRPCQDNPRFRWVYLDVGRFGGLAEVGIDYPLSSFHAGREGAVLVAGQTCDSEDVVFTQGDNYSLPLALKSGDRLVFSVAGAYTSCYATMFNGFPMMSVECI